ncbi:MAG: hypothetical protein NWQ26_03510 [Paraglaciecola sp.]|nr:hypothetical protein [Paraglaciecola sp.]
MMLAVFRFGTGKVQIAVRALIYQDFLFLAVASSYRDRVELPVIFKYLDQIRII